LNSVGGIISPEMEVPKLLWIKENLSDLWSQLDDLLFFDLADYLVYKCTGEDSIRSENTVACKWTYQANDLGDIKKGWQPEFFELIGLKEFVDNGFKQIGTDTKPVGYPVGQGVTEQAAKETGLTQGTTVSISMIDAHAGGVGILGSNLDSIDDASTRLALISGTSSCHMAMSRSAVLVNGVWGPFYNAMVPGFWVNEGGQSATGRLIDHVIASHSYYPTIIKEVDGSHSKLYSVLHARLLQMQQDMNLPSYSMLSKDVHVLDYFHGNRSPHADPTATGTIVGLTISNTLENLAIVYLATVQSIAYGTRHIIERINEQRQKVGEKPLSQIYICGGLGKNVLFVEQHAQICNCELIVAEDVEAMILGCAIIAYNAYLTSTTSGEVDFASIMRQFSGKKLNSYAPSSIVAVNHFHDQKYKIYHLLYTHSNLYKSIIQE
jgi:FGGY-family pentulose kinase